MPSPNSPVTSHQSRVTAFISFKITLLSKNASANHLESHSCKNKGLKVPCFHTLTEKGVGEGALGDGCHPDRAFRPSAPTGSEWRDLSAPLSSRITDPGSRILRASSGISPRFSSHESPVTNHKSLPLSPLTSALTSKRAPKPFRSNTYEKHTQGEGGQSPVTSHQSPVTNHGSRVTGHGSR